jgi:hypothetical protein
MLARARLVGPCLLVLVGTVGWAATTTAAMAPSTDAPRKATTPPPPGTPPPAREVQQPEPRSGTTPPPPSGGSTVPPPPAGKTDPAGTAPAVEPERPPVDLSNTWSRSRGGGSSSPRFVRSDDHGGRTIDTPNPEGYYSGVSVDGNHVPPFPAPKMGTKPALLTWTGFERTSGGSRVFFEVSAAVATKLTIKGSTLTLRISNTKINVKNNTRHLDLRYFRTPVSTVKVKRSGKDTIATIVLKRGAEPKVALVDGKAGYKLLVVEFADSSADAPAPPP